MFSSTHSSSAFVLSLILLLSLPVLYFFAPHLHPPNTLPRIPDGDEADDLALFRRATLSSVEPYSALPRRRSPPKVAFLFLTNSDLFFAPLWEKFFHGHEKLYNVYVHADPSTNFTIPLSPSFQSRLIPAKATQRASPTLISATRRLLAAALLDDPSNAFFAVVSQTCIPLHSFRFLYGVLVAERHQSFIEILPEMPNIWDRYIARGDNAMLPEVPFEQFRAGSQFFVLTRRHAVLVVRDRRLWKKFKLPCLKSKENSCYPEEHYFPTLLDMEDPQGCTRHTLTRVNWTDSIDGHPHLYSPPEVSKDLIHQLRQSNSGYDYLFARKFSPDCLPPLMKISDGVILRD